MYQSVQERETRKNRDGGVDETPRHRTKKYSCQNVTQNAGTPPFGSQAIIFNSPTLLACDLEEFWECGLNVSK